MPILKIETSEYECSHCGYKWTNRINGKDGPVPSRCARCKRTGWNDGRSGKEDPIGPEERGLRMRLYKFEGKVNDHMGFGGSISYIPNDFCKKFLGLEPRPTYDELEEALNPLGWNIHKHIGFIKDPDREGYLKYNYKEWEKLLTLESQKRREYMQQIIDSR